MPWGTKKEEIPDELKDLGLTPAQIRDAVLANKKLTEDLANSKTEMSTVKTNLSQLEGSFGDTKRKLDELEANSHRPEKKVEKEYTSFIDDENKAFTERMVDGMQPVAMIALSAASNSAKLLAKQSLQGQYVTTPGGKISLTRLWDKWSDEIEKAASEVNLSVRGNEKTWLNIFDYIKGRHFNELMAEPQTFVESVQTNAEIRVGDKKEPEKLNDSENDIIKKMSRYGKGVTPEGYQKTKDKMTFVNV
jgi:hypothetical protein